MAKKSNDLADMIAKLSEEMKENPVLIESDLEYPLEISGIKKNTLSPSINRERTGSFVKIRPCAEEYENKTYLGIYLGDFPIGCDVGLFTKTKILHILKNSNPAIFVPDLKKVIFGYESWWGEIESQEDLKDITNDDINNVWYVKVLKELADKEEKDGKEKEKVV